MDEKYIDIKINHLDLTKKRFELDDIFDSVIYRIPDLCMPSAFRLAGEDDFFDKTKGIRLVHFRKQRDFSGCSSPNSEKLSTSVFRKIAQPINHIHNVHDRKKEKRHVKIKHELESPTRRVKFLFGQVESNNEKEEEAYENSSHHNKEVILSYGQMKPWNLQSANIRGIIGSSECRSKLEMRNKLKKRYSNIKIKMNNYDLEEDNRTGYDKLFREKPEADYPFANPIAECMLTEDNIDNLREIIVSAVNIEWKMLTPIRPNSDYEEKYFDKLIDLHRNRYKSRLESGYFKTDQNLPFKHTRHSFIRQHGSKRKSRSLLSSADRKEKKNECLKQSSDIKMTIPTLTLTSDEKSSEPIINSDEEFSDDMREFDYGIFSRFSPNNMRKSIKSRSSRDSDEEVVGRKVCLDNNELEFANKREKNFIQSNDDSFEDQLESIISHLMNKNLTGI